MKKIFLIFLIFLTLNSIFAFCDSRQININKASLEELGELTGIGPVYAQRIIGSRPFENFEDLLNVKGIGIVTLEKIKNQNLACVENSTTKKITIQKILPSKIIKLNPKTIKTLNSKEDSKKKDYAKYSIFVFCILLLFLYKIKPKQKKNEWK